MDQETKERFLKIETNLKLAFEVIDGLDRAKVDHTHLASRELDKKNRALLDSLKLKYQKSKEAL